MTGSDWEVWSGAQCGIIELNHMPFLRLLTVGLWLMMSCSTKDMLHRSVASGWAGQVFCRACPKHCLLQPLQADWCSVPMTVIKYRGLATLHGACPKQCLTQPLHV